MLSKGEIMGLYILEEVFQSQCFAWGFNDKLTMIIFPVLNSAIFKHHHCKLFQHNKCKHSMWCGHLCKSNPNPYNSMLEHSPWMYENLGLTCSTKKQK